MLKVLRYLMIGLGVSHTSFGSAMDANSEELMILIIGAMYANETPITTGSRLPKWICRPVVNDDTNRIRL